jgi:RimJ/RimL family protein N-acetyltransferase
MTTIHTPRLILRPLTLNDADDLLPLFADWDVVRWLSAPPWPYTRDNMDQFCGSIIGRGDLVHEKFRVITLGDVVIGGVSINGTKTRMLGYWLGKAYWGRGFMSEAAFALVQDYFASAARRPLTSGAHEDNSASLKVQENVGFVVSRRRPQFSRPLNCEIPLIETELTRGRFHALHGNGKV